MPLSGVASSARQDTISVSPGINHNMNAGISLETRLLQTQQPVFRHSTVLLYCRRDPQHLSPPRGNLILSPRMSRSTFTGLFLHCLVLFSALLFFSHQTEQPLMSALCYWFHHLSCHALTGVYFFRCNLLMACLLPSASSAHYLSISSPFVVKCVLSTVCFFF